MGDTATRTISTYTGSARGRPITGTPLVLEATLDGDLVGTLLRMLRLVRSPLRRAAPLGGGRPLFSPRRMLTHQVDVSGYLTAKRGAMSAHVSQQNADDQVRMLTRFLQLPGPLFRLVFRREWFVEQGRPPDHGRRHLRVAARTRGRGTRGERRSSMRRRVAVTAAYHEAMAEVLLVEDDPQIGRIRPWRAVGERARGVLGADGGAGT